MVALGQIVVGTPDAAVTPSALLCASWATTGNLSTAHLEKLQGAGLSAVEIRQYLMTASEVLYILSGYQFPGVCTDVVRPCAVSAGDAGSGRGPWGGEGWYGGPSWDGLSSRWGFCLCNRTVRSGCYSVPEILLPGVPVVAVDEVLIDGTVVSPATYRVDDGRYLVRTVDAAGDGLSWPCCQVMTRPVTQEGTWQVTYRWGTPPPRSGVTAAAVLGYQLALASVNQPCALPPRVTSLVYQGASAVVQDPQALLDKGRTGLLEVDLFLTAVNPNNLRAQGTVWTPHIGERVRRAGQ